MDEVLPILAGRGYNMYIMPRLYEKTEKASMTKLNNYMKRDAHVCLLGSD